MDLKLSEAVDFLDAVVACSKALTIVDLLDSISRTSADLGYPYYAVFEAVAADPRPSLVPILARTHESWLQRYREAGLAACDLRLRKARQSSRDFFCSEVLRDDPDVTQDEAQFFVEAQAFGIRDSYVLPYRTAGGRVFAAVLLGPGSDITPELRVKIRTLAHEFLLAALRIKAQSDGAKAAVSQLTARQVECLAMIRDGKSSAEVAAQLMISARTVEHYVANACTRLGVRNRAQAVAKAIAEGLIDHPTQQFL